MANSEIAYKIVNQILGVKPSQVISISAVIQNANPEISPLSLLALIEELAMAIRKKHAFPVIEVSTENLMRRFFNEIPQEVYELPLDYYTRWVGAIDAFIDLGWRSNPDIYARLSAPTWGQLTKSTKKIQAAVTKLEKPYLAIGYPTPSMARYFHAEYENLLDIYNAALNCDYTQLATRGKSIYTKLANLHNYRLYTGEALDLTLIPASLTNYYGDIKAGLSNILPCGKIEVTITNLSGVLRAKRVFYGQAEYQNVDFYFENNKIYKIELADAQVNDYLLIDDLLKQSVRQLVCGYNMHVTDSSSYYLYEEIGEANIHLRCIGRSGETALIAAKKPYINGIPAKEFLLN